MSEIQFFLALATIATIYTFDKKIVLFINIHLAKNNFKVKFHKEYISYLLAILLIIVLILGVLTGSNNKKQFGNVEDGFERITPKDKPHPLFDIDTYF